MAKFEKIEHLLAQRKAAGAFRFLRLEEGLVDFSSNDYLGIAKAGTHWNQQYPKGSGGSRLLAGNYPAVEALEEEIAGFHHSEAALLFNSGYNANVGVFSSLPQKGDTILYDDLIHASVKDGMRLSFAKNFSFKHNDLSDLEKKGRKAEGAVYVVVESVYSMDGDSAPLEAIAQLCKKNHWVLVVDEAHGIGVFGDKGEGLVQSHGLENMVDIRIMTFGKAMGCHGAAVISNRLVKDFLINFARSFIYTTALPEYSIESIRSSYSVISEMRLTKSLRTKIEFFKTTVQAAGLNFIPSDSAIQCLIVPGNENVKSLSSKLKAAGMDVRPVMSPTVKAGFERLRICLHVSNSDQEIKALVDALKLAL